MADVRITNCHVHTFTTDHAPRYYPVAAVVIFRWFPWLLSALRRAARWLPWPFIYDGLVRLEKLHASGKYKTQAEVLHELLHFYPGNSRHVVLPMDMALIGHGPVAEDIFAQHDGLAALALDPRYHGRVIPFATVYPDRPGAYEEFARCVVTLHFRGLKLYPKLGFRPDHPLLMDKVYPLCVARNLPVVSHCSRGGVYHKGWSQAERDFVTEPDAFVSVLRAFPALRVNLAHFGGDSDWRSYLTDGFDPHDPGARKKNWVSRIVDMIEDEGFDNLYTDISYTIFKFAEYGPLLRLFLEDPKLRKRVLFGSDFYMTRQETLSEKAISIALRDALGEANFRQIAETNPAVWLGETRPA